MLGIISGTVMLQEMEILTNTEKVCKVTEFGEATLLVSDTIAFIPRHGLDPQQHVLPHLINHKANIKALRDLGVSEIIGINSSGSLHGDLRPGTIVIPDDFIMLSPYPSVYANGQFHILPGLDLVIRNRCLEAAKDAGIEVIERGIYWQTAGPRLETKAEIKMMARFADLVGMTMAGEAIIAKELALPYAALCSIDNYAHGLGEKPLTMDEISSHARRSGEKMIGIITKYIENNSASQRTMKRS